MNLYGHLAHGSHQSRYRRLGQADPNDVIMDRSGAQILKLDAAKALTVQLGNMYLGVHPFANSPTPEDFQFWMASTAAALAAAGNTVPAGTPTAYEQMVQSPPGSEWLVNAKLWRQAVNQGTPIDTLTMAWAKDRATAAKLTQTDPDYAIVLTRLQPTPQPTKKKSGGAGIAALVIGGLVIAGLAIAAA